MSNASKRLLISSLVIFLVIVLSALIISLSILNTKFSFDKDDYIYVPIGASLTDVVENMEEKFDLSISTKIKIYTKFNSLDSSIKPGRHYLYGVVSISDLLNELISSKNVDVDIKIIEGKTIRDIASKLAKNKNLVYFDSTKFVNLCLDKVFIGEIFNDSYFGNVNTLEGYLFPDTYRVKPSYKEEDLIKIFVNNFLDKVEPYRNDMRKKGLDTIMIIASIVQAETANENEMKTVSSLYYNRIKKNMSLDSDVTISYSTLKPMKVNDKYSSDPYNTYDTKNYKLRLPPTPINSPGLKAIKSSIYPSDTDYLFMFSPIAMKTHIFTKTNEAHEAVIDSIKALK
tara:strand:- start:992 stop:2017 length:1026 start_codon:yes stop_codon:yes gene_type:complete